MAKKKTRKEQLQEAVAEAVGAGKELHLESVDFSDPNRPKTCLEVDFPIIRINSIASIECSSGATRKPIYQISKWWARRNSSVFRSMLIAAATRAPEDPAETAKTVWDAYYGNHQNNSALGKLTVADIFMGGGTTLIEGARLGMHVYGNDLNPVAWFIAKTEIAPVSLTRVDELLERIRAAVRPHIIPFYACDCPRGHKGEWTRISTGETMGESFDPLSVSPEQRSDYDYQGPEVIYTFWAKHGPCTATECDHRTPIMKTPVIAVKTISVKAWQGRDCTRCSATFDVENKDARMAPGWPLVVADAEEPYATMDDDGNYTCPHCGHSFHDPVAATQGKSVSLGKTTNKKVNLSLLVHADWLRGASGRDQIGTAFGGTATDSPEATAAWNDTRVSTLRLLEVRGQLPTQVTCPETGVTFFTDKQGGTVPAKSSFACQEKTCGLEQDILTAVKASGKSAPVSMYAFHGYCPQCDKERRLYSGRFYGVPSTKQFDRAADEWNTRKDSDLAPYWPKSELPYGFMTHHNNGGIPNHGYTHWWKMFNHRQLLVLTQLLKVIITDKEANPDEKEAVLAAFQQYLRLNNMFCIWNRQADQLEPMFSNSNYHPKATMIENAVFPDLGRGNWQSCSAALQAGLAWCHNPWDTVSKKELERIAPELAGQFSGKSTKVFPGDIVRNNHDIDCRSSSDLQKTPDASVDMVVTDPPFGGLLHYSELADFFYVWLRLVLKDDYPEFFSSEDTPKALEAVANRARHPDNPDAFYQKLLTECWKEAARILKPSGLLAFTFHHSQDEPWVAVLESLFDAGFYLEAAYPIRSDETKGEGAKPGTFGSQMIEYDIIHVCRKRTEVPQSISWARLRRRITKDVRQLEEILHQHEETGLQQADLQVIRRGKALEHFSRHYGKVYIEKGREFTLKEALAGINSLLDDERDTSTEAPPVDAEPFTRQFLRLFTDNTSLPRDQVQKYLRGTGVSPADFQDRGWCCEKKKEFYLTPPLEFAKQWKSQNRSGMSRDMDQALFLLGACYEDSGIRVHDTLKSTAFKPHPAIGDILDWFIRHGGDSEMKQAAQTAKRLYKSWEAKNKPTVDAQLRLFDENDTED